MFRIDNEEALFVSWGTTDSGDTGPLQPRYNLIPESEVEAQEDLSVLEEFTRFMQRTLRDSGISKIDIDDAAEAYKTMMDPTSTADQIEFAEGVIIHTFIDKITKESFIISWLYYPNHRHNFYLRVMMHDATIEQLQKDIAKLGLEAVAAKHQVPVERIESLAMQKQYLTEKEQLEILQSLIRYLNSPTAQGLTGLPDLSRLNSEFSETNLPQFEEGYPLDQPLFDQLIFDYNLTDIPEDALPEMPEAILPPYQEGFDPSFRPENQPGFHIPEGIGVITPGIFAVILAILIAAKQRNNRTREKYQ